MRIPTFSQFQRNGELISQQFTALNRLNTQIITGKKIQSSSEDPVLASQIKEQSTFIDNMNHYFNNGVLAQNRMQLFSTTMQNSLNVVGDIRTQINKAQGGILSDQNRQAIAQQLQGDLSLLLNYANTADANGSYIFGGYNSNTPPYALMSGSYEYQGGFGRSYVEINDNVSTLFYESGFSVFSDIFNGNGAFTINANSGNTGTAYTSAGSIIDQSSYVEDTYTLTFVTNSSGELAYQVVGAASGQVIPPLPTPVPGGAPKFDPKASINFNGISFSVDGVPKAGDVFTVQPSVQENVFNSLQGLITLLQSPLTNSGDFNQKLTQISASFAQIASHLTVYQSEIGTIANAVDNQIQQNQSVLTNSSIALSGLEDAPLEQVSASLMQKQLSLQATTECYLKLQETLMQILKL